MFQESWQVNCSECDKAENGGLTANHLTPSLALAHHATKMHGRTVPDCATSWKVPTPTPSFPPDIHPAH